MMQILLWEQVRLIFEALFYNQPIFLIFSDLHKVLLMRYFSNYKKLWGLNSNGYWIWYVFKIVFFPLIYRNSDYSLHPMQLNSE